MTAEERMNEVGRMTQHVIDTANKHLADGLQEAKKDFCNFFHWYAADTYQAQKEIEYFTKMPKIACYDDISALIDAIKNRITNIEAELITSSAFGSCTNEVVNLEHRLKLDSLRIIREKLLDMLWVLEEN